MLQNSHSGTTTSDIMIKFTQFINNTREKCIFKYSILQEYDMLGVSMKLLCKTGITRLKWFLENMKSCGCLLWPELNKIFHWYNLSSILKKRRLSCRSCIAEKCIWDVSSDLAIENKKNWTRALYTFFYKKIV